MDRYAGLRRRLLKQFDDGAEALRRCDFRFSRAGATDALVAMFASFVGTWLPFALIFASTYATGTSLAHARPMPKEARP